MFYFVCRFFFQSYVCGVSLSNIVICVLIQKSLNYFRFNTKSLSYFRFNTKSLNYFRFNTKILNYFRFNTKSLNYFRFNKKILNYFRFNTKTLNYFRFNTKSLNYFRFNTKSLNYFRFNTKSVNYFRFNTKSLNYFRLYNNIIMTLSRPVIFNICSPWSKLSVCFFFLLLFFAVSRLGLNYFPFNTDKLELFPFYYNWLMTSSF